MSDIDIIARVTALLAITETSPEAADMICHIVAILRTEKLGLTQEHRDSIFAERSYWRLMTQDELKPINEILSMPEEAFIAFVIDQAPRSEHRGWKPTGYIFDGCTFMRAVRNNGNIYKAMNTPGGIRCFVVDENAMPFD